MCVGQANPCPNPKAVEVVATPPEALQRCKGSLPKHTKAAWYPTTQVTSHGYEGAYSTSTVVASSRIAKTTSEVTKVALPGPKEGPTVGEVTPPHDGTAVTKGVTCIVARPSSPSSTKVALEADDDGLAAIEVLGVATVGTR